MNRPRTRLMFGQLFECCNHVFNWIIDNKMKAISRTLGDVNALVFRHSLAKL
jgi:hypothetical protein